MGMNTKMVELFGPPDDSVYQFETIGTVVDTNDPYNMGRLRVVCPRWGDSFDVDVEAVPWAIYKSPFGGHAQVGTRGPGIQTSKGSIAYGMWAIPKVGSQVFVKCLDGNPMTRAWDGCAYDQFTPHTMPHGRFMYDDHPALEKSNESAPYGPYTSSEHPIEPLATNLRQQFGNKSEPNFEFRSRGADYSVAAVTVDQLGTTFSKVQDDQGVVHDDWTSTQGYQASRIDPHGESTIRDKNYDSQVVSLTTPGFHAISMDDRQENCRMRFRTTSGHQIIMDDTNERIYIASAKGNNWIEMDQSGNVDIYSGVKVNIHAAEHLNFTAGKTIRMHAGEGIHMETTGELRIHTKTDINVLSDQNIRMASKANTFIEAVANMDVKVGGTLKIGSTGSMHIKTDATLRINSTSDTNILANGPVRVTSQGTLNLKSSGNAMIQSSSNVGITASSRVIMTGSQVTSNGPAAPTPAAASAATAADPANPQLAFWTSRVPQHEPWARVSTADDLSHKPEFDYTSKDVNRVERGVTYDRGTYWRR